MTTPCAIAQEKESPNTLRLERVFRAPPSTVFRAWTDPGELAKWWGPDGYETVDALDVRPGGRYRTGMTGPDGTQLWVGGVFKEVTENERLVFTWAWEEDGVPGHETQVTLTLRDRGGRHRDVVGPRVLHRPRVVQQPRARMVELVDLSRKNPLKGRSKNG